jgi:hypothetical protein
MTVIIKGLSDMTMPMGLSREKENMLGRDLFGTISTIRKKYEHTSLKAQDSLWKIFGKT